MESGNVVNLQDFEQNEIKLKQKSFKDSIGTFFSLFDADLLLIWMNTFQHGFCFPRASYPILPIMLIISQGECNTGTGVYSDSSSMEEPAEVSNTPVHAYPAPSTIFSGLENPEAPKDRQDSSPLLPEEISISCIKISGKLTKQGFLEKVLKILLALLAFFKIF